MNMKEFLINLGVTTLSEVLTALVQTSTIGPNAKAAFQATLSTLPATVQAAENMSN